VTAVDILVELPPIQLFDLRIARVIAGVDPGVDVLIGMARIRRQRRITARGEQEAGQQDAPYHCNPLRCNE
jgi:hypothetical protein